VEGAAAGIPVAGGVVGACAGEAAAWNSNAAVASAGIHRAGRPGRGTSGIITGLISSNPEIQEHIMAERSRTRRNTLERRCLGKNWKRMFVGAPKSIFKILEAIKKI
jgi:hypothetical protein